MVETMGIILRFRDISIAQESFEERLRCSVQWVRKSPAGSQAAQINKSPDDGFIHWSEVAAFIRAIGDRVASIVDGGVASAAELDIGLPFSGDSMVAWVTIPAEICEAAGRCRIALTTTYYLTSREDESD